MRIVLLGIFVSALTLTCPIGVVAEGPVPLQPVDRPVIAGEKRCLPFFVVVKYAGASEEQIIFAHEFPDGKIKGDSIPSSRAFREFIDGVPAYEKTTAADGQAGILFKLSQADYDKAQACLSNLPLYPQPKP